MTRREFPSVRPVAVFDLVDGFAVNRGLEGPRARSRGDVRITISGPAAGQRWVEAATMVLRTTSDGFRVSTGRVEVGAQILRLPPFGAYELAVRSDYYEPVDLSPVILPDPKPRLVRLVPGPRYPLPKVTVPAPTRTGGVRAVAPEPLAAAVVRGTLRDGQQRPISGARVHFPGVATPVVTIGTGDWLVLLPTGTDPPPANTPIPVTLPDGRATTTTYIPTA